LPMILLPVPPTTNPPMVPAEAGASAMPCPPFKAIALAEILVPG